MKKLWCILFLLISFLGNAQNEELFKKANAAYADGNYEQAIEDYEQIVENGMASEAVYFNLGNAHYKLNNVAPSVYYYEKALQLNPDDPDVENNIQFARNMVIDDIPETEATGFGNAFNRIVSTFNYDVWAKLAVGFSVLFVILFLLYYFSVRPLAKRFLFAGAVIALLCGITSVFFAFRQQEIVFNNSHAIVFSEEAEVRNEPNLRGESAFLLHEGTKTRILEEYQNWLKIELADGTQGWIEEDNLRKL